MRIWAVQLLTRFLLEESSSSSELSLTDWPGEVDFDVTADELHWENDELKRGLKLDDSIYSWGFSFDCTSLSSFTIYDWYESTELFSYKKWGKVDDDQSAKKIAWPVKKNVRMNETRNKFEEK